MRPIRVLELRSVRGTGGGPEKTILLGAGRSDPSRFAITVCYIRDGRDSTFAIDQTAASLGVDYVEIHERHSFDPGIFPQLRALVRNRQIDIVHAHEYKTDVVAWLLARAEQIVPLSTAHGWTGHSQREKWCYYPVDKWVLTQYPRVIAVSSQIKDELVRAGAHPERVTTVLNGIDPGVFRRRRGVDAQARAAIGVPESAIVIGSVGRLEPQKRFDLLIDAFARLRTRLPGKDLRLVIVGDGSQRAALDAAVAAHQLQDSCILTGHRSSVVELLHGFNLFVQSSDYEGTPNAVLEAMALEVPVVATSVGGTAELMEHQRDGLLVPPGDAGVLAGAMHEAVAHSAAAMRWAAAARRRVEDELSFDARLRKVERIYESLMNRGGHAAPAAIQVRT